MPGRTLVSWNAMISCPSKLNKYSETLPLLFFFFDAQLRHKAKQENIFVYTKRLTLHEGQQILGLALKCGFENSEFVGFLYCTFMLVAVIGKARKVFDESHEHKWYNCISYCDSQ